MPNAIWSGSISFGLVSVPVKLYPATRSRDLSFHQIEEGTGARIRYRKVSEKTGEEVPNDRIVRGFEIERGRHVILDRDELEQLTPKATHTIDIEDFVDLGEIDPLYFETPYYVVPEEKAAKPYRLLVETMTRLGKVAIGRVVIRAKERLVAIRPLDGVLCVETMRYADEVLPRDRLEGLPASEVGVSERELGMAAQLVEALSDHFDPSRYHDEYREQVRALIDKKAAGEEIVVEPEAPEPGKVIDLMTALRESLARATPSESEEEEAEAREPEAATSSRTRRGRAGPNRSGAPAASKAARTANAGAKTTAKKRPASKRSA